MSLEISARKLERYFMRLSTLEDAAESAIYRYCIELDFNSFEEAAAALSEAVQAAIQTYGDAFAEANTAWIVQLLQLSGDATQAQIIEAAALEALASARESPVMPPSMASAIRKMGPQLRDEVTKPAAARTVARDTAAHAKRYGADMLIETVERANATAEQLGMNPAALLVAWVPHSPHPCGFCTMLASNGWRKARREALNEYAAHIHAGCHCQQVFRPANVAVGGYSPKRYRATVDSVRDPLRDSDGNVIPQRYKSGRANPRYWHEVALAIDRQRYTDTDVGAIKREQHRSAYHRREEAAEAEAQGGE